jgi:hypothetical protein
MLLVSKESNCDFDRAFGEKRESRASEIGLNARDSNDIPSGEHCIQVRRMLKADERLFP